MTKPIPSYVAEFKGNRKVFVWSREEEQLAQLYYPKWYSQQATYTLLVPGTEFHISSDNFWGTKFKVNLKSGERLGGIRHNWRGLSMITLGEIGSTQHEFVMRLRGVFAGRYEVRTAQDELMLTLRPRFNWKKFSYRVEVYWQGDEGNLGSRLLLLGLCLHTYRRIQQSRQSSG